MELLGFVIPAVFLLLVYCALPPLIELIATRLNWTRELMRADLEIARYNLKILTFKTQNMFYELFRRIL